MQFILTANIVNYLFYSPVPKFYFPLLLCFILYIQYHVLRLVVTFLLFGRPGYAVGLSAQMADNKPCHYLRG